jgi:hypothetical protein
VRMKVARSAASTDHPPATSTNAKSDRRIMNPPQPPVYGC